MCPVLKCSVNSHQPSWIVSAFEGLLRAADGAVVDNFAVVEDAVEDNAIERESLFCTFLGYGLYFFLSSSSFSERVVAVF